MNIFPLCPLFALLFSYQSKDNTENTKQPRRRQCTEGEVHRMLFSLAVSLLPVYRSVKYTLCLAHHIGLTMPLTVTLVLYHKIRLVKYLRIRRAQIYYSFLASPYHCGPSFFSFVGISIFSVILIFMQKLSPNIAAISDIMRFVALFFEFFHCKKMSK